MSSSAEYPIGLINRLRRHLNEWSRVSLSQDPLGILKCTCQVKTFDRLLFVAVIAATGDCLGDGDLIIPLSIKDGRMSVFSNTVNSNRITLLGNYDFIDQACQKLRLPTKGNYRSLQIFPHGEGRHLEPSMLLFEHNVTSSLVLSLNSRNNMHFNPIQDRTLALLSTHLFAKFVSETLRWKITPMPL